jgi:ribosomal 30S subunit maturation factor RimM
LGFKQKRIASPLVGLKAFRSDGNLFGEVVDVLDLGAGEVVEIKKPGGKIEMFPNSPQFLKLSDDKTRVIIQPFEFVEATPE